MARDIMYYFDKKFPYTMHELGEIQTNFNMSLVIDGTKDSMQIDVYGYVEKEIESNTILFHSATNKWWVVSRDVVKRDMHEVGFYYRHSLKISGAFELLNNRDLTDCGFNDNTYTIDTFIKRLFRLSTFEYPYTIDYGNNIDENKKIDYIKSYENYTPLSALRDFLGGYNCDAKLSFNIVNESISSAVLKIIPKSGNVDLPILNISVFDDIREVKSQSKESFGSTVISNVQNAVSTLTKIYPQVGGAKLSADHYRITPSNAILRLPTPIYKVVSLTLLHPVRVVYRTLLNNQSMETKTIEFYPYNTSNFDTQFEDFATSIADSLFQGGSSNTNWRTIHAWLINNKNAICEPIINASKINIETGWRTNPANGKIVKPYDDFNMPNLLHRNNATIEWSRSLLLGTKEDRDSLSAYERRCIYYERGDSELKGFEWMGEVGNTYNNGDMITELSSYKYTELKSENYDSGADYVDKIFASIVGSPEVKIHLQTMNDHRYIFNPSNTFFQVTYIPMSDLKIKQDNENDTLDTKLYNQNGKLNDSVALSKLFDSYSKEIQSPTITRYMRYYNFNSIPQIGQLVQNGEKRYVINNISYDFYPNETNNDNNVSYLIECEFTLNEYVATKSIMTSPNSNIRDYGIPQKYNVKRRQVYRDYFDFTFNAESGANADTPYVALDNYLPLDVGATSKEYDHTAIIKITYDNAVDGNDEWFYQLNSTAYILGKSLYEVIDFNDNNIIGYDMQNTVSGFNMSRIFSNQWESISTPVSYVDDDGKAKGFYLAMVDKNNLEQLYEDIMLDLNKSGNYMLSSHCFVGREMYYGKHSDDEIVQFVKQSGVVQDIDNEPVCLVDLTDTGYIELDAVILNDQITIRGGIVQILDENGDLIKEFRENELYSLSVYKDNNNNHWYLKADVANNVYVGEEYSLSFFISYIQENTEYDGAVDIADYVIEEPNYDKDAIEVPVFEYSLQIGDTKDIEIGDSILKSESGILVMYQAYIGDANEIITKLNASKHLGSVSATSSQLSNVDNYSFEYDLETAITPVMTYESNNTKLRIEFYESQTAVIYGNVEQKIFEYQETQLSQNQLPKSSLVGRDIVIVKHTIKNLLRTTNPINPLEPATTIVTYSSEVLMIIHRPTTNNFEENDMVLNVNHYKLK